MPILRHLSPALLLASAAAAQTPICGSIRDGAGGPLLSGVVYHTTGNLSVSAGQTLTVQAGAIVKFSGHLFTVDGTLDVNGTAGSPVIFTSIHDDSAGGDTNGNGNATAPGPDQWYGISLSSSAGASTLDFASIRYTGAGLSARPVLRSYGHSRHRSRRIWYFQFALPLLASPVMVLPSRRPR